MAGRAKPVREAWARYRAPVDYGILPLGLPKVAALMDAGLPTRLYYTEIDSRIDRVRLN